MSMSYEQYVATIKAEFKKYRHTDAETEKYFSTDSVKDMLLKQYDGFTKRNVAAYAPQATASCLDMMYE